MRNSLGHRRRRIASCSWETRSPRDGRSTLPTSSRGSRTSIVASAVKRRRNPRVSALMCESRGRARYGKPKFIEKELSRTKLVATYPTSLARLASNSTHENSTRGWVNYARQRSFGALRHHRAIVLAPVWRIPTFFIDLLTRGATRIILIFRRSDPMISGRNVCSVPRFDVATGQMGEARHTAMAHVKSAMTGVCSAL